MLPNESKHFVTEFSIQKTETAIPDALRQMRKGENVSKTSIQGTIDYSCRDMASALAARSS